MRAGGMLRSTLTVSKREFMRDARLAGLPVLVLEGEMSALLERLRLSLGNFSLHSHEETGNWESFQRDRRVLAWCRASHIE